jgi:hypothetical protein
MLSGSIAAFSLESTDASPASKERMKKMIDKDGFSDVLPLRYKYMDMI